MKIQPLRSQKEQCIERLGQVSVVGKPFPGSPSFLLRKLLVFSQGQKPLRIKTTFPSSFVATYGHVNKFQPMGYKQSCHKLLGSVHKTFFYLFLLPASLNVGMMAEGQHNFHLLRLVKKQRRSLSPQHMDTRTSPDDLY